MSIFPYEDILHLPHPEPDPAKHPRMSRADRAAQFAPFKALTGFEEAVEETAQEAERAAEDPLIREAFMEDP